LKVIVLCLSIFLKMNSILSLLPEDAILTQQLRNDCSGDGKKEIICVYDINSRFGTEDYKGTCVTIFEEIDDEYREVYKIRLTADTRVQLVKIFDNLPPFIEVQWFHSKGGGNTYIYYQKELKRFREILNIEGGGISREDLDGDGREEVFSIEYKPLHCKGRKDELYAGFLTFYRYENNKFFSFPKNPYMVKPKEIYFAGDKRSRISHLFNIHSGDCPHTEGIEPEDISFNFFANMDMSLLTVVITVIDDIIMQYGEGKDIVYGDHLEILLDTDMREDFCRGVTNYDDIVIGVSPGNFDNIPPDLIDLNPSSRFSKNIRDFVDFLVEKQLNGYKVSLTFNLDKGTLEKGLLGLGIILYDSDQKGSGLPEVKLSWPCDVDRKDPTTWGNLYRFRQGHLRDLPREIR